MSRNRLGAQVDSRIPPTSGVAVIIAAYGRGRERALEACILSLERQSPRASQIVVSEEYACSPAYIDLAREFGVRYIGWPLASRSCRWSPGAVRNRGACHSTEPVLLFMDADLVCLFSDVVGSVEAALQLRGAVLHGPRVHRILECAQGEVLEMLRREPTVDLGDLLPQHLLPVGDCFWSLANKPVSIVSREYHGNAYCALADTAAAFHESPGSFSGREAEVWKPRRHMGTIAVQRELFVAVGGVCEEFQGWGWEDQDLIRKLRTHGQPTNTACIDDRIAHLEHSHSYICPEVSAANIALFESRVAQNAMAVIEADRRALLASRESERCS